MPAEPRRKQVAFIPPEMRDPKLPTGVFSFSQYSTYRKCGESYRRQYVEGHKLPMNPAMFQGILVHAGAEEAHLILLDTGKVPELKTATDVMDAKFKAEASNIVEWGADTPEALLARAKAIYEVYHTQGLPKVRPLAAEKPFAMMIGNVPMQGYIDLVEQVPVPEPPLEEGKEPPATQPLQTIVADMKTSTASWSQADIDRDPQFTLYSIVENVDTVRVDNLVSVKAGPKLVQLTAKRDAHTKAVFVQDLEETADFIKRGIFPKAPLDSWGCTEKWCGYWSLCRGKAR